MFTTSLSIQLQVYESRYTKMWFIIRENCWTLFAPNNSSSRFQGPVTVYVYFPCTVTRLSAIHWDLRGVIPVHHIPPELAFSTMVCHDQAICLSVICHGHKREPLSKVLRHPLLIIGTYGRPFCHKGFHLWMSMRPCRY